MKVTQLHLHPVVERELRSRAAALGMAPDRLIECCLVRVMGLEGFRLTSEQVFGTKQSVGNKKEGL